MPLPVPTGLRKLCMRCGGHYHTVLGSVCSGFHVWPWLGFLKRSHQACIPPIQTLEGYLQRGLGFCSRGLLFSWLQTQDPKWDNPRDSWPRPSFHQTLARLLVNLGQRDPKLVGRPDSVSLTRPQLEMSHPRAQLPISSGERGFGLVKPCGLEEPGFICRLGLWNQEVTCTFCQGEPGRSKAEREGGQEQKEGPQTGQEEGGLNSPRTWAPLGCLSLLQRVRKESQDTQQRRAGVLQGPSVTPQGEQSRPPASSLTGKKRHRVGVEGGCTRDRECGARCRQPVFSSRVYKH